MGSMTKGLLHKKLFTAPTPAGYDSSHKNLVYIPPKIIVEQMITTGIATQIPKTRPAGYIPCIFIESQVQPQPLQISLTPKGTF
jgi:hypothetical protein